MCGMPDAEELSQMDDSSPTELNVTDGVIAEMLARVAAGCSNSNSDPELTAEFAKRTVKLLLQFRE